MNTKDALKRLIRGKGAARSSGFVQTSAQDMTNVWVLTLPNLIQSSMGAIQRRLRMRHLTFVNGSNM